MAGKRRRRSAVTALLTDLMRVRRPIAPRSLRRANEIISYRRRRYYNEYNCYNYSRNIIIVVAKYRTHRQVAAKYRARRNKTSAASYASSGLQFSRFTLHQWWYCYPYLSYIRYTAISTQRLMRVFKKKNREKKTNFVTVIIPLVRRGRRRRRRARYTGNTCVPARRRNPVCRVYRPRLRLCFHTAGVYAVHDNILSVTV